MKTKATYRWYRLRAGSHTMTAWIGDAQLTYLALHKESGWVPESVNLFEAPFSGIY